MNVQNQQDLMTQELEIKLRGVLETCLYVDDLDAAEAFYSKLPGLKLVAREEGRHIFYRCNRNMLLLFNPVHTANEQTDIDGNPIPLHGTSGAGHIAFSVDGENIDVWKELLVNNGIQIESEVTWPNEAVSLYFRDPAGNSLEIVSPSLWNGNV